MLRVARYTLAAASITLTLAGCQDATAPADATHSLSPRPMMSDAPSADLVEHIVAPKATDVLIDRALADHYAWVDTKVPSNHKLLVFMPSARGTPATFTKVAMEGARLGYHAIGLMYQNDVVLAQACPPAPDPSKCYENVRLDVLDGGDRSLPVADVSDANSIDNRLTKLLLYLDNAYPDEGWSRFLKHGEPRWSHIAVAGHSQGGGQAAMIAKVRRVARVVMFSSVPDSLPSGQAPAWLASHMTPSNRYFGLAHECDAFFRPIVAGWDSVGMGALVATTPDPTRPGTSCRLWTSTSRRAPMTPEGNSSPYGGTHMLITNLLPQTGVYVHMSSHHSTANDLYTPLDPVSGTPLLLAAWRYLLGEHEADEDVADDQDERDEVNIGSGGGTRRE
jgi:hypothetical protein